MKKKFLSILLVLTLCLNLFPAIALADEHVSHADENHDHLCDTCGMPCYTADSLDDNRVCSIDGCNALETNLKADYTNLYYFENYEKAGEISAGGAVEIAVTVFGSDSSVPQKTVDGGKVVVYWTDENGGKIPFSEMEMPLIDGKAKVFFGGIPAESLNYGHIVYYPSDSSADYLPSCEELVLESQDNVHNLSVESDIKFNINYTPAAQLPVLSGTLISVDLLTEAEGSYTVAFDEENTELEYIKEGKTITFTMPEKDVNAVIDWISCTVHADSDRDHQCDVCKEVSSVCEDKNSDHKCDVCRKILSACDDGMTADHKCDICKKAMSALCKDENGDHLCDVSACSARIAGVCADSNYDHYCDSPACSRQLTSCETSDSNGDAICDICKAEIYWLEVKGIRVTSQNKDNILEDEAASVVYEPETKTLTLNNADIRTSGNYGIRSRLPKSAALNIRLTGENYISADGVYGLRSTADVIISGSGSLEISAGDIAIYLDGAGSEYGSLTLCDDVEVAAAGGKVTSGSGFGVKVDDCLTVRDNARLMASSVSAPDRSSGVYAIDVITVRDNAQLIAEGGDLSGKAGTDSYGIRTTHICVDGGFLLATGGNAADSVGIYTQTFDMTGGEVYASGAYSAHGPSYGLRSNKYLNMSGGSIIASGGETPKDQSCGLMVNNTSSDSFADDGGTLTVTGGRIQAVGKAGAFSYGVKANNISVSGGIINAEAGEAAAGENGMTISSGITAENIFTITGGQITSKGASAGTFSYGMQAFDMNINGGSVISESGSAAESFGLWSFDELALSGISTAVQALSENGCAVYSVKGIDLEDALNINSPENGIVAKITDGPEAYYAVSSADGTAAEAAHISAYAAWTPAPEQTDKTDKTDPADKNDQNDSTDCPCSVFSDLSSEAWYHEAVDFVLEEGLMNGVDDDKFDPDGKASRAMIVTILWRLEGKPACGQGESITFSDVPEHQWYTEAIEWAASEGIVEGCDGRFSPDRAITREQLAAILYRFEQSHGGGFKGMWMFLLDYADRSDVSDWAYEAMCWMNMNEVIQGRSGGILAPKDSVTRAETAAMLQRYCEVMTQTD